MTETTNPDNAASESTFEDKVKQAIADSTVNDSGKTILSKDLPESVSFSANAELRRRATQAEYTQKSQAVIALEAEKKELLTQVQNNASYEITKEREEELEDLQSTDPESWRQEINKLETIAKAKLSTEVSDKLKEVSEQSIHDTELANRTQELKDFQEIYPNVMINDDVIKNDIPLRITSKLKENKITFHAFLTEVHNYLSKAKTIAIDDTLEIEPSMTLVGGSSTPLATPGIDNVNEDYAQLIY